MTRRAYGQFCGLARAVEIVGERWALLIIRDLLVGPRRFTDLRQGLPRVPTNILSTRLKELEQAGVVRRRALPRPERSVVYELTGYGRDLEETVLALSRWGARTLGTPRPDEIVTTDSLIMALRSTFRPAAARGLRAGYELRFGEIVVHADVADGTLTAGAGGLTAPDLVIEAGPALPALMAGELSPGAAVASGAVRLIGEVNLLDRFADIFHIGPPPAVPR